MPRAVAAKTAQAPAATGHEADRRQERSAPPNPLWSRLATHLRSPAATLQRSPLSDQVRDAFNNATSRQFDALLARLSQTDVQSAQTDTDVDAEIARLLAGRSDDLWVAQEIRRGRFDLPALVPGTRRRGSTRPVQVFYFQGVSSQRALVIAGVHGSERQGTEVARTLIRDLQSQLSQTPPQMPHFTTIVVPSLFPDNEATGTREGSTKTNRNFPRPSQDLAAARAAGGPSGPVDSRGRLILLENVALLTLIERFRPERIISIHGTWRGGSAGVFFDPRDLTPAEVARARSDAASMADFLHPGWRDDPNGPQILERLVQQALAGMRGQAATADEDLSRRAATAIDTATGSLAGRDQRRFANREGEGPISATEEAGRRAHPSIAGNIGSGGAIDHFTWSGSGTGGISLGEYAPPRGMSVFTVEPPINANTGEYTAGTDVHGAPVGAGGATAGNPDPGVSAADRQIELQSYADAVRTVLLGQ